MNQAHPHLDRVRLIQNGQTPTQAQLLWAANRLLCDAASELFQLTGRKCGISHDHVTCNDVSFGVTVNEDGQNPQYWRQDSMVGYLTFPSEAEMMENFYTFLSTLIPKETKE